MLNGVPVPVIMTVTVNFPPPDPVDTTADVKPARVGGDIIAPKKLVDVPPIYPPDALAAGISGVVIIQATIGTDGKVTDAKVLRSVAGLDDAALTAVRQWEYTKTTLNGVPTPIIMTITVNFIAK
jgi:protein TonB